MISEDVRVASLIRHATMSGIRNVLNTYKEGHKVSILRKKIRAQIAAAVHRAMADHVYTAAFLASRIKG